MVRPAGREPLNPSFPLSGRLRAEFGPARAPRRLASSPRSNVWRADLGGTPTVLKQIVGGPDAAARYAREVTALRLAARVVPPVAPRLLGTDAQTRTLILEDLADDGPPGDWVVEYAAGLARLHAATGPADAGLLPRWHGPDTGDVRAFVAQAGRLGIAAGPDVSHELAALVDRLKEAPGHALLHGDPCPGNDLYAAGEVRFVDFEQAALGNGLAELAYLRVGFPTCWCVTEVPEPLLGRAEAAYRTTWHALTGSPPEGDVTDACAGWLIRGDALVQRAHRGDTDHLARLPAEDWSWGTVSARERLAHRLTVVARLTVGRDDLSAVSHLVTTMRERMGSRWPGLRPPPSIRPE
jgi:aminoglycoside phosphotransferase (APT) family kinase protein